MPISFDTLTVGATYDRNYLASLWGYADYHAIARGCVTPAGSRVIIFFITRERQEWDAPYQNALSDGFLHMDGEESKANDERIVATTSSGEEIYLFYRDLHRAPFTYYGKIDLVEHWTRADKPTRFQFRVPSSR